MKITLGPIPFLWDKERILSFYKEIADSPASVVYIGEVVCSKRSVLGIKTLSTIAQILKDAGKEVVISTFGLVTNKAELDFIESLHELPFPVEANNPGTLNIFTDGAHMNDSLTKGHENQWDKNVPPILGLFTDVEPSPFVDRRGFPTPPEGFSGEPSSASHSRRDLIGGPHLAVYNAPTAQFFHKTGITRLVFMPELERRAIETISQSIPSCEKEIIVFGNLPLAFSWRCYTARAVNLSKTNCAIVCKNYPDGMPLETMDGMSLFNINGTQLISSRKVCMVEQIEIIRKIGIENIRIIPQIQNTTDIIDIFSKVTEGTMSGQEALEILKLYAPEGISNGWFYGKPGWEYVEKDPAEVGAGHSPQSYIQDDLR
ncbi:MAG: U32 family peptidase [Nitrospirae bacterium]|nr:U32 family peptidase [Nitrospirota bacterium]